MKTPDQVIADVTARLRRSWPHVIADDELCRTGHDGEHATGGSDPPAWPHSFPLGAPGRQELEQQFAAYQAKTLAWRQWHTTQEGIGVELVDATRRVHGTVQAIPTRLRVADIDAAAGLSGREWAARLARGRTRAATLLERFMPPPDLPRMLREVDDWADVDFALLCDAAAWFRDNDATGLTPRQVPVPGMHAKWLNTRQHLVASLAGLETLPLAAAHPPRVHLTYLDPEHRAAGGRRHDCISVGDQAQLPYTPQVVIISENKDTAVAFPAVTGGVCVEGGGFGGAAAAALPWLIEAPLLVYWGDIDAAGFEILDGFRADGVPAISMLMDLATFDRYERYGTSLDRRGNRLGPGTRRDLPHLDAAERTMYHALTDPAWQAHRRIEQERIPLTDALTALQLFQLRYLPVERAAGDGGHDNLATDTGRGNPSGALALQGVGSPNGALVADLRVRLRQWSCGWQHRGLVMVRMLYLMFVRLDGAAGTFCGLEGRRAARAASGGRGAAAAEPRPKLDWADRAVLAALARLIPGAADGQAGHAGYAAALASRLVRWRWTYPSRGGRPSANARLAALIEQMVRENPGWGYRQIQGETARPQHSRRSLECAAGNETAAEPVGLDYWILAWTNFPAGIIAE